MNRAQLSYELAWLVGASIVLTEHGASHEQVAAYTREKAIRILDELTPEDEDESSASE